MKMNNLHHQLIIHWAHTGEDGYGGSAFDTPAQLVGRWESGGDMIRTSDGDEVAALATAFLWHDIAEGDYLMLGDVDDLDSATADNPQAIEGALEVRQFRKTPDYRGRYFERKAMM